MAELDPRIILMGQQPDFARSLMAGIGAAGMQNEQGRANALAGLYQQQGAGIMAGDPRALNALAGIDPQAALGVRETQQSMQARDQGMAMDRERLSLQRQQAAQQAAEYARGLSAEERAAQAAVIETALTGAIPLVKAGDVAGYMAWLRQNELDPVDYPMENFPQLAYSLAGVRDAYLEANKAPNPSDRFKVVGSQLVDLASPGGPSAVMNGGGMEETIFGQDGQPIVQRRPVAGAAAKPMTEAQSKDTIFAARAEGALNALEPVADALTSRSNAVAGAVPLGLGRDVQSEQYQVAKQAGDEFLQAILRKDTGAAITEQEQELYGKTYLPQPGDSQAVLDAKKLSRARALEALRAGMDARQITAAESALVKSADRAGSVPQGLDPEDMKWLEAQ